MGGLENISELLTCHTLCQKIGSFGHQLGRDRVGSRFSPHRKKHPDDGLWAGLVPSGGFQSAFHSILFCSVQFSSILFHSLGIPSGFRMDSIRIPVGFHVDSRWIPSGIRRVQISGFVFQQCLAPVNRVVCIRLVWLYVYRCSRRRVDWRLGPVSFQGVGHSPMLYQDNAIREFQQETFGDQCSQITGFRSSRFDYLPCIIQKSIIIRPHADLQIQSLSGLWKSHKGIATHYFCAEHPTLCHEINLLWGTLPPCTRAVQRVELCE